MELLNIVSNLGPVAGTVVVVVIFARFGSTYMKNERAHREQLARECHEVQSKATEATFKAVQSIDRNSKVLDQVNRTLIRMNGDRP